MRWRPPSVISTVRPFKRAWPTLCPRNQRRCVPVGPACVKRTAVAARPDCLQTHCDSANQRTARAKTSRGDRARCRRRRLSGTHSVERLLSLAGSRRAGELADLHPCARRRLAAFWFSRLCRKTNFLAAHGG